MILQTTQKQRTYCISCDHVRDCIVSTEIQANFHAGIATTNHKNPLVLVIRTRLVDAGMSNGSMKSVHPRDFGDEGVGILAGGNNEPLGNVVEILSSNGPEGRGGVELGCENGLVEPGVN